MYNYKYMQYKYNYKNYREKIVPAAHFIITRISLSAQVGETQ